MTTARDRWRMWIDLSAAKTYSPRASDKVSNWASPVVC